MPNHILKTGAKDRTTWSRRRWLEIVGVVAVATMIVTVKAFSPRHRRPSPPVTFLPRGPPTSSSSASSATALLMTEESTPPAPTTFREAEVLGLKLMQEGNYEQALIAFKKGLQLPGSRADVVRTKSLQGPSPVGGAMGGLESQNVLTLDEFELQAAYYNMACAHAELGQLGDSIAALRQAFENGFDNYSTVRGDPDLDPIKSEADFRSLMEEYDTSKKGFNPFGFLGNNKK